MNRPGTSDTEECSVSRQERGGGGEGGMDNVRPSRNATSTSANPTAGPAAAAREGNTEEDWKIYEILCKDSLKDNLRDSVASNTQSFQMNRDEDLNDHEMTAALRSELAALQYKRDRLFTELQDMKTQLRSRDQRVMELQAETEQLKEQAVRQNAIIASLRKRIQELEERERNLNNMNSRSEMAFQTLQRECRHQEERAKDLEHRVSRLELECNAEEQQKEMAQKTMADFLRRLSNALGIEGAESHSNDALIDRVSDLVQDHTKTRIKSSSLSDSLATVEIELRESRNALNRALMDKENLQRQAASHLIELERLRKEKEDLETQQRLTEKELCQLRDKLSLCSHSLGTASDSIAAQQATITHLKGDLCQSEEKTIRVQNELRHVLESLAIMLGTPTKFCEASELSIKERIRDLLGENKDKSSCIESLRDKLCFVHDQLAKKTELWEEMNTRVRILEEEKAVSGSKLNHLENEIRTLEAVKDKLQTDKAVFVSFLERLSNVLNVDDISKDVGDEYRTDALLVRAEQLARLESDKIVDKWLLNYPCGSLPCLKRGRSCCDLYHLPLRETAVVYQLQRRVRTLRDQLQRRDLHLDLLRRKLNIHENSCRVRSLLEAEKDEANLKVKKLLKQADRLQLQLTEARALSNDLKIQLAEAANYKVTAIERGKKIEELQKRIVELEMLRTRYARKVALLKQQCHSTCESAEQERCLLETETKVLKEDLINTKQSLAESVTRENALLDFKRTITNLLGLDCSSLDFEVISRLTKVVNAHREFTSVSQRYNDPTLKTSPQGLTSPDNQRRHYAELENHNRRLFSDVDSKDNRRMLSDVDSKDNRRLFSDVESKDNRRLFSDVDSIDNQRRLFSGIDNQRPSRPNYKSDLNSDYLNSLNDDLESDVHAIYNKRPLRAS
ncbi:unnamed protein product [Bemisia tabaci]|uniref:Coiled-coil domain-containing protein 170 n=1 Tax=Bemisia tabaci TaxID=7038 RepID=A0AAI8Y616_BEMTA|nr:unnamed protein product [Bemisia tabaci]